MPVMQVIFSQNKFAFRIENNKIRIEARAESAFAIGATSQPSRRLCHPAPYFLQRESSAARLSPHQRQCDREACDAAPGGPKTAIGWILHFGRAGSGVGSDQVNRPLSESLPHSRAI